MLLPQQDKILLVEDEMMTQRRLLRAQLEKQGYAVLEAEEWRGGAAVLS